MKQFFDSRDVKFFKDVFPYTWSREVNIIEHKSAICDQIRSNFVDFAYAEDEELHSNSTS